MGKKAIDVVLLPSEEVADLVIEANRRLVDNFASEIVLNKKACLPHISLVMGCIENDDIAAVGEILIEAAGRFGSTTLTALGLHVSENIRGERVSSLRMDNSTELQTLHEELTEELSAYLSYDVTAEMIYDYPQVADTTLGWIREFRVRSSFANFFPHITVGYGLAEGFEFPIEFTAAKLAMCHLGNHCTCREVLTSVDPGSA